MKKNFTLSLVFFTALTIFSIQSNAQCATTAYVSNGGNCISLSWFPIANVPNPLPATIESGGSVYTYSSGLGDVGFPAVYKKTNAACELPTDYVNGNITFNIAGGSSFTCSYPNGILLALQNISLNAYTQKQQTILEWSADTKDIKSFEIQKSADGKNFKTIASIAPGTVQQTKTFRYADQGSPVVQYYRLRVVESNNIGWYSKVIKMDVGSQNQVSVYPNPAKGTFVVSGIDASAIKSLNIYDAQGRKISFKASPVNSTENSTRITVSNTKGMIYLSWYNGTEKSIVKATIE